jgi:SAM-dependent methyltransferase
MQSNLVLSEHSYDVDGDLKRVLNAGSGSSAARRLHPVFKGSAWQEVRLDIDPIVKPDLIGSIADMSVLIGSQSFEAVWASHSLEHLPLHEVRLALGEFRRILKPGGFALITSPDLETVAALVVERGLDHVAYESPIGPITAHDMIFGHGESIRRGMGFMAHKSGFTCAKLGALLLQAGFPMVLAKRLGFDVWALALMNEADKLAIQHELNAAGLNMFDDGV